MQCTAVAKYCMPYIQQTQNFQSPQKRNEYSKGKKENKDPKVREQ